jgi:hypothetical protein
MEYRAYVRILRQGEKQLRLQEIPPYRKLQNMWPSSHGDAAALVCHMLRELQAEAIPAWKAEWRNLCNVRRVRGEFSDKAHRLPLLFQQMPTGSLPQEGEGVNIKEKNGGEFRTDLSVAQPPCTKCRHADICDLPPTCHALRYFETTGRPITPPRVFPGDRREEQPAPAPAPQTMQQGHGLRDEQVEALRAFEREMQGPWER